MLPDVPWYKVSTNLHLSIFSRLKAREREWQTSSGADIAPDLGCCASRNTPPDKAEEVNLSSCKKPDLGVLSPAGATGSATIQIAMVPHWSRFDFMFSTTPCM